MIFPLFFLRQKTFKMCDFDEQFYLGYVDDYVFQQERQIVRMLVYGSLLCWLLSVYVSWLLIGKATLVLLVVWFLIFYFASQIDRRLSAMGFEFQIVFGFMIGFFAVGFCGAWLWNH